MFNSVIGNTIESNTSDGDDAAAIFMWASNGNIIVGNTIRNNVSAQGAVQMYNSENIVFSQNLVYGNSISGNVEGNGGAGGLYLAIPGGAHSYYGVIANNTFANNTTSKELESSASQVFIDGDVSEFSFVNNVLYGTGPDPLLICNGSYAYLSPGPMLVENNDVFNPSGPAYDSSCANGPGMAGNIAVDPLFNNPSNNNFHLQSSSPAIDVGNNQALTMLLSYGIDLATDLDGHPRVQDATGKGCIIDMGAYEYPGTLSNCSTSETLTSSLNPATVGQTVTFTSQLSAAGGTPTGTIQFLDGANLLSTQTVSGTGSASFSTNSLAVGSHTITANYQPTGSFGASTASLTQVIDGYTTGTTLACLPNPIDVSNTAQFTAAVTSTNGTPTGSIAFTDNGASLATQGLVSGTTSLTYTGSIAGTHNITATYTPTGSFAASSATCSEVVNALPTTSVLTVTPATSTYGSPVTLTANVTPAMLPGPSTPTGVVTFYNGASVIGTGTLAGGVANLAASSLPGGSYNLTCMYSGSVIYATSNCNSVPVVVTAAPTSIGLTGTPNPGYLGQTVTMVATVSSQTASTQAGGSVTFYDGSASLGSAQVTASNTASLSASFSVVGVHSITAVYGGDASFSGSSSAVLKETILAGDFSIAVLPEAVSVHAGGSAAVKIGVASLQGFRQPLALTCSGLPANTTCSFSPASMTDGQGEGKLEIQTTAPHPVGTGSASGSGAALGALMLLLLPGRRRRRGFLAGCFVVVLMIGAGMGMAGCGSSFNPLTGGTPPGTYNVAVTASTTGAGTPLSHSAAVTLTVKPQY
jgi:MYXO-CTERM domain-containing protein